MSSALHCRAQGCRDTHFCCWNSLYIIIVIVIVIVIIVIVIGMVIIITRF